MKIGQKAYRTQAALVAAATLMAPGLAAAGPSEVLYERTFAAAAGDRCGLFEPPLAAALSAAAAQARGAALRDGATDAEVAAVAARARARAAAVSCRHPDLAVVGRRVEDAFAGWSRTPRMTFPGTSLQWVANRAGGDRPGWRLWQTSHVGASPVTFGYAGKDRTAGLSAVVSWHGRPRPYAARLVARDPARAPRPWLSGDGLAPAPTQVSVWSSGGAAADTALLAGGRHAGEVWRFPASTAAVLERLDPRETFAVEFHFRDGSVATVKFEAGDFAAGRAFLAMGSL